MLKSRLLGLALTLATATAAASAPVTLPPAGDVETPMALERVHYRHSACQLGARGYHRHNQFGERLACRRWDGRGVRPRSCVRLGPFYYCE